MDPLTLTTGIVTLLRASAALRGTVAKVINLRDAPALVQAVNNEISDLHLVILHISDYFERAKSSRTTIPSVDEPVLHLCSSTLDQTRSKVQEVEALINDRLLKTSKKKVVKVSRKRLLREQGHLIELQTDLRSARQRIVNLFGHFGIRDISRIEVILSDMRSNDLPMLMQSQMRIEETLNGIMDRQLRTSNHNHQYMDNVGPQSSNIPGSSSLRVSISPHLVSASRPRCTCRRRETSIVLRTFLGNLFLGYNVAPSLRDNQTQCLHHMYTELRLVYVFPIWLLKYAISAYAWLGMPGSITCSLAITQVIPDYHAIFDHMYFGDLRRVEQLLQSGQVSVNACGEKGSSLLEQSILMGNTAATRLLIYMGADAVSGSFRSMSPQKLAWDRILTGLRTPEWRAEIKALMPYPDFDELYDFSPLHNAVLGLTSRSLEDTICAEPTLLDQKDRSNKTALSWAALKGDQEAVRIILSHRPDLNTQDSMGRSPLAYAVQGSRECADLLLQAGADIHTRTSNIASVLHLALQGGVERSELLRLVKSIVQAGVDVDAKNLRGENALYVAAELDMVAIVEYLIKHEADPSICTKSGSNPLYAAAQRNAHSMVSLLLQEKQDHTETLEDNGTFMHLAAEFADTETLRLLSQGHLQHRDINVKNRAGITPIQLALQRKDVSPGWLKTFCDFLRSIDQDQPPLSDDTSLEVPERVQEIIPLGEDSDTRSTSSSEEDQSDVIYEDAVESQI